MLEELTPKQRIGLYITIVGGLISGIPLFIEVSTNQFYLIMATFILMVLIGLGFGISPLILDDIDDEIESNPTAEINDS